MKVRVLMGLAVAALFANSSAKAAVIVGVTSADPAATVGPPTIVQSGVTNNNDVPVDVPGPAGTVEFDILLNELHTPFNVVFDRSAGSGVQEYLVTINVTNGTPKIPVNNLIVDINGSGVTFDEDGALFNPAPTGGVFTHDQPTNKLTFNGFTILPGATRTFTFSIDIVSADVTDFTIQFTANPEPASMALAGLASCGLGGLVVRRRRKANVKV